MYKLLLNISNHPFKTWQNSQREAAFDLVPEVVDTFFPRIEINYSSKKINKIIKKLTVDILKFLDDEKIKVEETYIYCIGDYLTTYRLVVAFKSIGFKVIVPRSERCRSRATGFKRRAFKFRFFEEY